MRKHSAEKPPGKNDDGPKHIVLTAVAQMIAYVASRAIWEWLSYNAKPSGPDRWSGPGHRISSWLLPHHCSHRAADKHLPPDPHKPGQTAPCVYKWIRSTT